jgi:hypothetical protein
MRILFKSCILLVILYFKLTNADLEDKSPSNLYQSSDVNFQKQW